MNLFGGVKALSKYITKHKRKFILFYLGWLFDSIFTVITPIIFAIMIDEMVYYKDLHAFLQISFVFVVLSVFSCVLYFFDYTLHHYLMSMYTFDIKLDLFKKMQSMKASFLSDAKTGDMINMLLDDTDECMHFVIRNVIHLINNFLKGAFYIVYIYIISIPAGLVVTVFLPFAAYSTFKFSKRIRRHTDDRRELYGGYISRLFEFLKGLADIRLLCAERIVRKDFTAHHRRLFHTDIKMSVSNLISDKIIEGINLMLQLSVYGVCAYLAFSGQITIGSVLVLVSFVFTLKDETIYRLAHNFMDGQARLTCISRIKRFLAEEDENSWRGRSKLNVTRGEIEFRNVHFGYEPENPVLQDFTVSIPSGSHIAITGKSGCGKTTLASLLTGMYELKSGMILVDGQNITECSLKSIRQSIGVIQQDVMVFDATIRENLLLGNPKATEKELWEACKKTGIIEYFENLPQKLDTLLGRERAGLSGGQRQRLAIARIYLKNPSIIIFDEATSALDSETEQIIHSAWRELLVGRTAIIIAHRLSSVLLCDHAILIEDGRVQTAGRPDELMQTSDRFKELYAVKGAC